jgi:hypothetical protein
MSVGWWAFPTDSQYLGHLLYKECLIDGHELEPSLSSPKYNWCDLSQVYVLLLQAQFKSYERMGELWEKLRRREAKETKKGGEPLRKPEVQFIPALLNEFLQVGNWGKKKNREERRSASQ